MTPQEVFDRVVTHARTQKERCVGTDGKCLYRGPGGMKCFIGALISDVHYSETLENTLGSQYRVMRAAGLNPEDDTMTALVDRLQTTHDYHEVYSWEGRFQVIAQEFNLNMP